ncbi:PREDICTED: neuroguidin-like [Rhagoletis zephyria]|uniref:neuroguidin-like n=1 Tax=Rhagoletis zephyria TaxID=28612 RepID=UPI0008116A2E|nr:PREDICTED: neuroguidin-like [Rhagoletis zephyria]KAH9409775.1 hypothetical protein TYRP_010787 [Tyrophagus putrescentiae]
MADNVDLMVNQTTELLKEFKSNLSPCIYSVKALLEKMKNNELPTENGISLFDMKNKMFLSYLVDLTDVLFTKLRGESIAERTGTLERLVEERTVLEKIRPIEHKLKYQVDKLMKVLNTGAIDQNDPMNLKPNFSSIAEGEDGEDGGAMNLDDVDEDESSDVKNLAMTDAKKSSNGGVYVPPRLAQMKFEDEHDRKTKALEHAKKRAMNSSIIKELRREFDDAPEEEYGSMLHQKSGIGKFLKEKKRFEEDNFIRINLTKKQKAAARKMATINSIADDVTRFEDISALDISNPNDFVTQKRRKPKTPKNKKKSIKRRKH